MIIVQLKCTVICSQHTPSGNAAALTINVWLETPDRLQICVWFLTSSCLILFLESIEEDHVCRGAGGVTWPQIIFSTSTWFCTSWKGCLSFVWHMDVCVWTLVIYTFMFSLYGLQCVPKLHCVFFSVIQKVFMYYISTSPLPWAHRSCGNSYKQKNYFYESVFYLVAGRILQLLWQYSQPLMPGSGRQRNRSLYTLCTSDQSHCKENVQCRRR